MIDGDDTLWENNIYFEAALERFIDFLDHSHLSREQVREAVAQIEKLNIASHGYGSRAFARNLELAYESLRERSLRESDSQALLALAREIIDHELEILPGVTTTLADLSLRNDLILFTKGESTEQQLKVERSGLAHHFKRVVITPKKRTLMPTGTWWRGTALTPSEPGWWEIPPGPTSIRRSRPGWAQSSCPTPGPGHSNWRRSTPARV